MLTFTPLTWADAGPLYVWRNDPATVKWSLNPPPTWDEHLRWLNKVIAGTEGDPRERPLYRIYRMGYMDPTTPVVTVSVNITEVSITTNPCFRKHGFATEALRHVQSFGLNLEATIKKGNEASIRLFSKCGFCETARHNDLILMEWTP